MFIPNQLMRGCWRLLALSEIRCCTENCVIALIISRFQKSPVVCSEDAGMCENSRQLLAEWSWNCERSDARWKWRLLSKLHIWKHFVCSNMKQFLNWRRTFSVSRFFKFHSCSASQFTCKWASPMQTMGNHGNLLPTTAITRRFSVSSSLQISPSSSQSPTGHNYNNPERLCHW